MLKELEQNKETVCRNYQCAELLSTLEECLEHFRDCGVLGKCKTCSRTHKSPHTHKCSSKVG